MGLLHWGSSTFLCTHETYSPVISKSLDKRVPRVMDLNQNFSMQYENHFMRNSWKRSILSEVFALIIQGVLLGDQYYTTTIDGMSSKRFLDSLILNEVLPYNGRIILWRTRQKRSTSSGVFVLPIQGMLIKNFLLNGKKSLRLSLLHQ